MITEPQLHTMNYEYPYTYMEAITISDYQLRYNMIQCTVNVNERALMNVLYKV